MLNEEINVLLIRGKWTQSFFNCSMHIKLWDIETIGTQCV